MVVERFLGLKHVEDTTSKSVKMSLLQMLAKYGLSVGRLRGQGYDGASVTPDFPKKTKCISYVRQDQVYTHMIDVMSENINKQQ
jgi:hypothetical protein